MGKPTEELVFWIETLLIFGGLFLLIAPPLVYFSVWILNYIFSFGLDFPSFLAKGFEWKIYFGSEAANFDNSPGLFDKTRTLPVVMLIGLVMFIVNQPITKLFK